MHPILCEARFSPISYSATFLNNMMYCLYPLLLIWYIKIFIMIIFAHIYPWSWWSTNIIFASRYFVWNKNMVGERAQCQKCFLCLRPEGCRRHYIVLTCNTEGIVRKLCEIRMAVLIVIPLALWCDIWIIHSGIDYAGGGGRIALYFCRYIWQTACRQDMQAVLIRTAVQVTTHAVFMFDIPGLYRAYVFEVMALASSSWKYMGPLRFLKPFYKTNGGSLGDWSPPVMQNYPALCNFIKSKEHTRKSASCVSDF